jgi:hypothetical protein
MSATKGSVASQEQLASMSDVRAMLWKLLSMKVTSWTPKQATMILDCLRMISKVPGIAGVRPSETGHDVQDVPISIAAAGMDVLSAVTSINTAIQTEGDLESALSLGIKGLDGFSKVKKKQATNKHLGGQIKTWTDALFTSFEESFGTLKNLVASKGVTLLTDKKQAYEKQADEFQGIALGHPDGKSSWSDGFEGNSWKEIAKHAGTTLMKAKGADLDGGVTKLSQVGEGLDNHNVHSKHSAQPFRQAACLLAHALHRLVGSLGSQP